MVAGTLELQTAFFGLTGVGVVQTDLRTGRLIRVNEAFCAMVGYSEAELKGLTYRDLTHPDDVARDAESFAALQRGESRGGTSLTRCLRKDGEVVWLELHVTVVEGEGGERLNLAVVNDVTERKRAEAALSDSEERYRRLFTSVNQGFCIIEKLETAPGEPSDFRYLVANPAFERHTGLRDPVGKTIRQLVPEADTSIMDRYDRVARTGQPERFEDYVTPLDLWLDAEVFSTETPGQLAVLFSNITKRKRAEEALRTSEEKYRMLFEMMHQGFGLAEILVDEAGRPSDYRMLEINPQFERLTGQKREIFLDGRTVREIAPELEEEWYTFYGQVGLSGVPAHRDIQAKEWHRWFEVSAHRTGRPEQRRVGIFFNDITERRQTEQALRESEEKYRTLFDTIDEGFAIIEVIRDDAGHPVDLLYREVNQAVERHSGHRFEPGQRVRDIFPDVEEHWLERYDRVSRTGVPEHEEIFNSDTNRWYRMTFSPVGGAGSPLVSLVFSDITERKRAEAALREREERQAFLLRFSDALRAEPDADAVANRALQMLYEHMGLDRCYIASYHLAADRADITHQVGNDRVPAMPDTIRLSDFPAAFRQVFDRTLVIDDVAGTAGLSDSDRRSIGTLGLRALVAATLRQGESNPHWVMVAVSATPRRWTPGEMALAEEVAERTWAAVERARAEEALRDLNETLEQQILERTEELRRSQVRFIQAFHAGPVAACISTLAQDPERETFLEVNERFAELTGYTPDEAIGRTAQELGMWSSEGDQRKLAGAQRDGGSFRNLKLKVQTKEGAVRDVLLSAEVIRIDGHHGFLKLFYDVTEQKRSEEQLYKAIQEVMSDTAWFSRQVLERLAQIRSGHLEAPPSVELTARERQVLALLAQGKSNEAIATELSLATQTVRNYISIVYDKLEVHSRAEAVVWARERGIVS